jgi:hypothetical protein
LPQPPYIPTSPEPNKQTGGLPPVTAGRGERADQPQKPGMPRDVETRPATDEAELVRVVPGSQSWNQMSVDQQEKVRQHYRSGKSNLSIRFKNGQFDEPGYGDQGQYGDVVRALNKGINSPTERQIQESLMHIANKIMNQG